MTRTPGLDLTPLPTGGGTVLVAGDGGLIGSYAARAYTETRLLELFDQLVEAKVLPPLREI